MLFPFIERLVKSMKILKKIGKISIILLGIFLFGNICLYIYCLITPKIQISKNQSYYLYDNKNRW